MKTRTELTMIEKDFINNYIGAYEIDFEVDGLSWNKWNVFHWLVKDLSDNIKTWTPNEKVDSDVVFEYVMASMSQAPEGLFV